MAETAASEAPRIVDAHCHIASEEHIPRAFVEGGIANVGARLASQGIAADRDKLTAIYLQKLRDPLCDRLVEEMDGAGIALSVLLAADFTFALDCPVTIEESYARHREVLERHPGRFVVFGGMDPRWGKDGVDLFERAVTELGFRGFKVYPPCGFSPSDRGLFPFYEICARHRLPVTVHVGPTSPALSFSHADPFLLDEAAHTFPGVDFILAHGSVNFTDGCAMMCAFRPNVYLDVSAYQSIPNDGGARALRKTVSRGINHKVLFGTDWPVFRLQGDQRSFVELATAPDGPLDALGDAERALVLHGNADRLLARAGDGASA